MNKQDHFLDTNRQRNKQTDRQTTLMKVAFKRNTASWPNNGFEIDEKNKKLRRIW